MDVTYQRAFMASPVQQGLYQISPERERYYDMMANNIIGENVGSEGTINDEDLRKAITILKSEEEAGHERNIDNMTKEDDYKLPWKDKDATTVNNTLDDTAFTFLNSLQDDTSDSSKQVDTSKEPIKDTQTSKEPITDTHIVNRVSHLQDGPTNVDPVVTGVGSIGQGIPRAIIRGSITQRIIHGGGGIICRNVITHVLTNSSEMPLKSDSFPFDSHVQREIGRA